VTFYEEANGRPLYIFVFGLSKEPWKGGAPFAVIRDTVTLPLRIWDSMLSLAAVQLTTNIPYDNDACMLSYYQYSLASLSFSLSPHYCCDM